MYLEDDFEKENSTDSSRVNLIVGVVSAIFVFMVIIIIIVLVSNWDKISTGGSTEVTTVVDSSSKTPGIDGLISGETITSDDLDIWEEFPAEDANKKEPFDFDDDIDVDTKDTVDGPDEDDLSEGGIKTKIIHSNGQEEWQYINQYLTMQDYDNANFVLKDGRLAYYTDSRKASFTGVDLCKYNGYVDFNKVAKDGVDFVMIRLGSRTYSTGQISIDEYYNDNLKRATDAGLDVGLVFMSQAVTEAEAIEEAKFVLDNIGDYEIEYPICFDMEPVANDEARIDKLSKEERTKIARAFMDKITEGGYTPVLYGDKEWLLTKLNYASVSYYDIWLNQFEDLPDFPYDFKMWKYKNGVVDGISGKADITISFIDYSMK